MSLYQDIETIINTINYTNLNEDTYDIRVKNIKNTIENLTNNYDYIRNCYEYINDLIQNTNKEYYGYFNINEIYQKININTSINILSPYQIIFISYQLMFITDYQSEYEYYGKQKCPSYDVICCSHNNYDCVCNYLDDINNVYDDIMITNPDEFILGDNFFENVKYKFYNINDIYNLYVSPNQHCYDCNGIINNNLPINCCNKKYTWTLETSLFFDYFLEECPKIINYDKHAQIILFYVEIK